MEQKQTGWRAKNKSKHSDKLTTLSKSKRRIVWSRTVSSLSASFSILANFVSTFFLGGGGDTLGANRLNFFLTGIRYRTFWHPQKPKLLYKPSTKNNECWFFVITMRSLLLNLSKRTRRWKSNHIVLFCLIYKQRYHRKKMFLRWNNIICVKLSKEWKIAWKSKQ